MVDTNGCIVARGVIVDAAPIPTGRRICCVQAFKGHVCLAVVFHNGSIGGFIGFLALGHRQMLLPKDKFAKGQIPKMFEFTFVH
jgi:hypothetical protein